MSCKSSKIDDVPGFVGRFLIHQGVRFLAGGGNYTRDAKKALRFESAGAAALFLAKNPKAGDITKMYFQKGTI